MGAILRYVALVKIQTNQVAFGARFQSLRFYAKLTCENLTHSVIHVRDYFATPGFEHQVTPIFRELLKYLLHEKI